MLKRYVESEAAHKVLERSVQMYRHTSHHLLTFMPSQIYMTFFLLRKKMNRDFRENILLCESIECKWMGLPKLTLLKPCKK